MNKVTIEQKAKAYDIALDKIKMLLGTGSLCSREELEYVFPELTESEDERIRKQIKAFIKSRGMSLAQSKVDSWIAWLEKQGEPTDIPTDAVLDGNKDGLIADTIGVKQGEQKPMKTCAEYYNKNSEFKMPELSVFQNKLADILMQREYEGSTETEEDIARARLDYELAAIRISEELLPLAIMQKSAEWNKEDREYIQSLLDIINGTPSLTPSEVECHKDWLKSLKERVHPKQEWSEDDEIGLDETIELLQSFLDEVPRFRINAIERSISWLQSLKPQDRWRPTKEQLEDLGEAISTHETDALERLYHDLEKLCS